MNGECKCRKGYSGAYCQYKESEGSSFFSFILYTAVFLVVLVMIGALFYGAFIYLKRLVRIIISFIVYIGTRKSSTC